LEIEVKARCEFTHCPLSAADGPDVRSPTLLLPALSLLDRLRTTSRLGVVIALLLVPGLVATVAYTYGEAGQISFSSSERDGVEVLKPALAAMATLTGSHELELGPTASAVHAHSDLGLDAELSSVRQTADLNTAAGRLPVVEALAALVSEAGNASNLILDPDLDSFYVMDAQVVQIPRILSAAASAEAAAGATGSAKLVATRAVLAGELSSAADALRTDLKTAAANTKLAGLNARLSGLVTLADAAARLGTALTQSLGTAGADPRQVAATAGAVVGAATGTLDDLLDRRIEGRQFALIRVLAVTIVGFLLAFWFAAAVWWRSRHDVAQVVSAVEAIARRDTSDHQLPAGRDEFGDIGRALRQARQNLAEQDAALQEAQRRQAQQTKDNFIHQRRAEKQARQLAQQLITESITALRTELDEVAAEVNSVRSAAGMISERVGSADEALRSVLDQASNADQVTSALGERLQRVAGMTKLIASVADQTKLLALNATIEAARAGAAGQGFSVVANEVKELAATTARSTEEITGTIAALEREAEAVSATITAMTSGIGGVDQATGALLGVAGEQRNSVASMELRIASALERIRGMSDLSSRMERRMDERMPVSGVAVFTSAGRGYELQIRDLSEGGLQATSESGVTPAPHTTGRLELPVPGLPAFEAEVLRSSDQAGDAVAFGFARASAGDRAKLREYLDQQFA
jgi:methyl-accepting chemotaxis protein